MIRPSVKLAEIVSLLNLAPSAQTGGPFKRLGEPASADAETIVFAETPEALEMALGSAAGLIFAPQATPAGPRILAVRRPRLAFAQVYAQWFDLRGTGGIDAGALIDPTAAIGAGCEIGPGAFVGAGVSLGAGCILGPRAAVLSGCSLGERVRVQAGAVLGSEGFGYVRGAEGYLGFPQIGTLHLDDDVEIGANTTIDRGALGETRIGRGTKIDNLVHIAHNCRIGQHVVIAAQTGIAGSCIIEDGAVIGGQVGLGDHVTIGPGVILGSGAGVLPHKHLEGPGKVFWGTPAQPVKSYLRDLARLRRS